jgi:dTMP kinase
MDFRGTFIMLEGGEGSGKSTLARNLEAALIEAGREVVRTREPGGTPWGEKIRNILIEKDETIDHHLTPAAQLLGHYMARFEHLDRVIVPALAAGKVVISDRFELSSYSYQVHAQGDAALERLFLDLHGHVVEKLRPFPCLYLFCDVDPVVGLARVATRNEQKTVFDEAPLDFHHRVREGMVKAQTCIDPHFACVTVDAHDSPEAMLAAALQAYGK